MSRISKKKIKKQKKRKVRTPAYVDGYLDTYKEELRKLTQLGFSGTLDEEGRAEVASQLALIKAAKEFSLTLKENLKTFDTNIGLLMKTNTIYPVSLVIPGTGQNGQNEYIQLKMCAIIGEIESLEEHTKTVQKNHEEAVSLEEKYGRINPSLEASSSMH